MSKNFEAIKKKYFVAAVAAGVVLGVCVAVALTCVLAVILKRCAVDFHWALYIPVAAVLAAGFSALFFLILRPTDNKIAKKLDRDFALNQKVQTMVEYAGADDAMAVLQREQANEVLGEVSKKRIDLKWLLKFAFIPVLAVAMLFTGIFVPAKKRSEYTEPTLSLTEEQAAALASLIEEVKSSSLEAELKASTIEVLNELMEGLRKEQPQSVVRAAVISSVKMIDALVAATNSYVKIYNVLKADENTAPLAQALVDGVVFFKYNGIRLTSIDAVKACEKTSEETIGTVFANWEKAFLDGYQGKIDGNGTLAPIDVESASKKLQSFASSLNKGLKDSTLEGYAPKGEDGSGDGLYVSLADFYAAADKLASDTQGTANAQNYFDSIKGGCDRFTDSCVTALRPQSYNCIMDEYIRNALAKIFGMSVSAFGTNTDVIPEGSSSGRPNPGQPGDPYLPGDDPSYGSDDLVLNVDTGLAEKYGPLLTDYKNAVDELIASGACSDDVAQYIRQYFRLLFSGLDEEE